MGTTEGASLHFKSRHDASLLAKFNHYQLLAVVTFGKARILHIASSLKMLHDVLQAPTGLNVQYQNRATGFLDFSFVEVDRKWRIFGKIRVFEFGVVGFDDLVWHLPLNARHNI